MSENYIVINGKKADLTPEQLKALGIEVKKPSSFDRSGHFGEYYLISATGETMRCIDHDTIGDRNSHKVANYCTDKDLLQQQAYRETLNRLLWRFSMENGGGNEKWGINDRKYYIIYSHNEEKWIFDWSTTLQRMGVVYFDSAKTAERAIEKIVKPFMESHPDFKL